MDVVDNGESETNTAKKLKKLQHDSRFVNTVAIVTSSERDITQIKPLSVSRHHADQYSDYQLVVLVLALLHRQLSYPV
jgi:hypothetical protein